ncbi:hypothetical protein DRH29_02420 [candidate division Kazan bacterium]|uniref:Uncharacterized protein n=1 Tax=candidate division Kazan bacterium TaxID=2202143 RepID=A0A420ZD26_UNCK3|nr:MAG: hypothetical protein DRH29_02420 [candidate division Kazan bacterium]
MRKFLHHFRRDRKYFRHDRWTVFGILAAVTLLVLLVNWTRLSTPKDSNLVLTVSKTAISENVIPADGSTFSNVGIWVQDQNGLPADSVWIGLKIYEPSLRTPAMTYLDWYSPEPERAFYQTNRGGWVEFPIASKIAGEIEYHIYTADPKAPQNQKYQNLNSSFVVTFE